MASCGSLIASRWACDYIHITEEKIDTRLNVGCLILSCFDIKHKTARKNANNVSVEKCYHDTL